VEALGAGRREERLLAVEVPVDRGGRDPDPAGDLAQREVNRTRREEQVTRRGEQARARVVGARGRDRGGAAGTA
jgi:hypothetical protein